MGVKPLRSFAASQLRSFAASQLRSFAASQLRSFAASLQSNFNWPAAKKSLSMIHHFDQKEGTTLAKSKIDLIEPFNTIKDDRDDKRLLYQMGEIIFLIVADVLCCAESLEEIAAT